MQVTTLTVFVLFSFNVKATLLMKMWHFAFRFGVKVSKSLGLSCHVHCPTSVLFLSLDADL